MLGTEDHLIIEYCPWCCDYILKSKLCFLCIVSMYIYMRTFSDLRNCWFKLKMSLFDSELQDYSARSSFAHTGVLSASIGIRGFL